VRAETWVSLVACLIGAAVPLAWMLGPGLAEGLLPWVMAGTAVLPLGFVAATAWLVRSDARSSRVVAAVALLDLAIGVGGWAVAATDPEGGSAACALFLVPGAQVLTWFGGAILSGRRPPP
jgi:hypothetical protein